MTTPDLSFAMRVLATAQRQVKNVRAHYQAGNVDAETVKAKLHWEALREDAIDQALAAWGEAIHEAL